MAHEYQATIKWARRGDEKFTDNRYSRAHTWTFDGGIEVPASSAPSSVRLPFSVAEAFTGTAGVYVPIAETIRGFSEILEGKHDEIPESHFLLKGTIDDVVAAANES